VTLGREEGRGKREEGIRKKERKNNSFEMGIIFLYKYAKKYIIL
jgi:hypothetical protein